MPLFKILPLAFAACCLAPSPAAHAADAPAAAAPAAHKVLRYAFRIAETSFDPAQITDLYSRTVAAGIFEAPLEYEYLAKPARMRVNTAAAMPEVSADFKTFTFRIKPGIYFADDPAFKGVKRELVAEDYVYSLKRHFDPRWKSGNLYILENAKILGLNELRKRLIDEKKPFDYDAPVEGLRALGPLHLPGAAGRGHPALSVQLQRWLLQRRAGARGGGVLRRQDRRTPGGHRPVPAERLEAQFAHRAHAQPELPRGALRREPSGR
jgi:ABC-type transport system substrate-binding protein